MNKKAIILLIVSVFMLPSFVLADVINGTINNDVIEGTPNNDVIYGWAGHDRIYGYAGHDNIFGHWGADTIYGGVGDDNIDGGLGIDVCYGEAGIDVIEHCETNIADQSSTSDVMIVIVSEDTEYIVGGIGTTEIVLPKELEAAKAAAKVDAKEKGSITNPLSGKEIFLENTDNIVIK